MKAQHRVDHSDASKSECHMTAKLSPVMTYQL